ncbi:MAG TPA: hypothetical protein VF178_03685, partial [Gemmatimonadaceae bacterium]
FPVGERIRTTVAIDDEADRASLGDALQDARVLVLASGFYLCRDDAAADPWLYFAAATGTPLFLGAIAGPEGVALITQRGRPHEDGLPVVVPPVAALGFLTPGPASAASLAAAHSAAIDALNAHVVGDAVKDARAEGPTLIAPRAGA